MDLSYYLQTATPAVEVQVENYHDVSSAMR